MFEGFSKRNVLAQAPTLLASQVSLWSGANPLERAVFSSRDTKTVIKQEGLFMPGAYESHLMSSLLLQKKYFLGS